MLKLQRFILCPRNTFQYYDFVKHERKVTNTFGSFSRLIRNSGFLVAGCCFSRQSDEETLLPESKKSYDVSKHQPDDQVNQSNSREFTQNTDIMKRSCEMLDDVACQPSASTSKTVVSDTADKRRKVLEDETKASKNLTVVCDSPVSKNAELLKRKSKKCDAETGKPKKCRPNYFVAIQISDDQIHRALKELQQHMLDQDESVKNILIPPASLHITLMVMYLKDNETHARAVEVLENIHKEHDTDLSKNPLKLEFKGLSHFQNRVLFAKLSEDDSYKRLSSLSDSVKKHFEEASIVTTDSRKEFTPHLTVAKIRHDPRNFKKQRQNKITGKRRVKKAAKKKAQPSCPKKIDPVLYKSFSDHYFGYQHVKSIQLLSMTGPKDEAGYYTGKEIFFSAFEPNVRCESLNRMLEIEEKKKNVKEVINALLKNKV